MPWQCGQCGHEGNDDASQACAGCGHIAVSLVLTAESTGKSLRMNIETSVSKMHLGRLDDDDCRFASSPQFKVYKDVALGAWALRAEPSAKNPTYLNGSALPAEPAALKAGDVISIGPERMKLRVAFERT